MRQSVISVMRQCFDSSANIGQQFQLQLLSVRHMQQQVPYYYQNSTDNCLLTFFTSFLITIRNDVKKLTCNKQNYFSLNKPLKKKTHTVHTATGSPPAPF